MFHFYTFIREGKSLETDKPNFATFEDGHVSMCITDAILESNSEQKWVKVKAGKEVYA
ncbi:MAG: hypothetical protein ACXVNF_00680 [Neobacillus sp.]